MKKLCFFCFFITIPFIAMAENCTLLGNEPILVREAPSPVSLKIGTLSPHTTATLLATDQTTGYALVEQATLKGWIPTEKVSAQDISNEKNLQNTSEKHWQKAPDSPTIRPDSLFLSRPFWALVAVCSLLFVGLILHTFRKRP